MLKHGIDPAFSRRGSKFKTPVCRYARPREAATTRSTNFASVSCCARLTANPGGDWRKAHSKRDCNCANLYYSLPNEHPRTVSGGTHAHVSGQQEATSIPNGTDSPLPRSMKIIIKHCRPLRRQQNYTCEAKAWFIGKKAGANFLVLDPVRNLYKQRFAKCFAILMCLPHGQAKGWLLRNGNFVYSLRFISPLCDGSPDLWDGQPLPPEDGGRCCRGPTPRPPSCTGGGCLSDPHRLTSLTMSNLTGNNELANSTPELFYQTEQRSPKLHDMHILPRAALNFLVGTIYPKKKTSNKMTSRHQPWLTPSLPYCPLHFSNCICSSFMTSRWKGAYKQ